MLTRRAIGSLRPEDLPPEIESTLDHLVLTPMQQIERETIAAMLRNRRGNKVAAAAELGIARSTLYRKIRTYRLDVRQVY
jgi:transcriptional regulator of acetoin/glycerol metabolism